MSDSSVDTISIIIPTYNESEYLSKLLNFLHSDSDSKAITEIIISDGRSTDDTLDIARRFKTTVVSTSLGRAMQLNAGAKNSSGDILYFLHADSIPPPTFVRQILKAHSRGYRAGCFRLRFDWDHWFLKANAWFTRFNISAFHFGDQSLFVTKKLFDRIGGFREDHVIMEDQEIICRILKHSKFKVIPDYVTTSARKYRKNGPYRMQGIFYYIYMAHVFGASQKALEGLYQRLIRS
jgi:rSAM/selenodomain-associated transferase 2